MIRSENEVDPRSSESHLPLRLFTYLKDRTVLEEQLQGATQAQMIREWANVIERIAADNTIAIEDIQWADQSTLTEP